MMTRSLLVVLALATTSSLARADEPPAEPSPETALQESPSSPQQPAPLPPAQPQPAAQPAQSGPPGATTPRAYPQPQPYPPPPAYPPGARYPVVAYPPPVIVTRPAGPPPPKPICIEGRPLRCQTVFILEAGARFGTATTSTFDIGLLVNHGHNAYGATIGALGYEEASPFDPEMKQLKMVPAYKARYRRYLGNDGAAVDLGIGGGGRYGASAEVALGFRDIIAVTAGANTFPQDNDRAVAGNVGVRIGTEGLLFLVYVVASVAGR